jgi:hypothetical protein
VNHISTVRQHLLDTLADLRNKENPMEIDRARAVADVANVIVNTAKVEVDYLKVTNQTHAPFLDEGEELPNGISSITRHRLQG